MIPYAISNGWASLTKLALTLQSVRAERQNVRKSARRAIPDYQDRISALQKRLEAAVEEHRRMRRELAALEDRDRYELLNAMRSLPHVDEDGRN